MKRFNTTGVCNPSVHYMVDIKERVDLIRKMVDGGDYFTINRARQYGKTTTISELHKALEDTYLVISLDFQGIGADGFRDEAAFVKNFCRLIRRQKRVGLEVPDEISDKLDEFVDRKQYMARLPELFDLILDWVDITDRQIVLIIDEVDSASNNQVFLDFLSQLRDMYINRESKGAGAIQSVILAGVTDIRHLKSKIRDDKLHKVNSPWNIAAEFDISMELDVEGISKMLDEYSDEHGAAFDTEIVAISIEKYTSGYPFLVSRICQIIDEKLVDTKFDTIEEVWTPYGVDEAVKILLAEKNTLFESLSGKLSNYPDMNKVLKSMLMEGVSIAYNPLQESINQLEMYGFVKNYSNTVAISNIVFETLLYNLYLSDDELKTSVFATENNRDKNSFVNVDGVLNVEKILEGFIESYIHVFGPLEDRFKEKDGRELFLLYLKPIINGTGNFYIEPQTRDSKRMDIVIDYLGKQYIIELKIWRGHSYHETGEKQTLDYLSYFGLDTGYMLVFNFNKSKQTGVKRVEVGDKVLIEGML